MIEEERKNYILNLSLWLYYYNNIYHMLLDKTFDSQKNQRLISLLEVVDEYDFLLDSDYNS